jgi:branched-chain amino acid transport system substrate-binding protein
VHAKGQGTGPKDEVGQVLYMRGLMARDAGVEGVRAAQERFGKGKVMTGEQARWGYENLNLDQKKLDALGFAGVMRPCPPAAPTTWAPPGRACTPGTAASGPGQSDWCRPTSRSSSRWSRLGREVRGREEAHAATPADCQS